MDIEKYLQKCIYRETQAEAKLYTEDNNYSVNKMHAIWSARNAYTRVLNFIKSKENDNGTDKKTS